MTLKTFLTTLTVACSIGVTAQTYPYETVKGDPMQSRIYTLGNGLKVYLSVNKDKPRLQTYIAVKTGSRNDPAETTGLAHYLEHLMFKGTKQFGTSNAEAEAPLLDSIQTRLETYRLLKDPVTRKQAYHEIDSISQIAAQYNIPNEYDKLMRAIGAEGTNAYTSNDVTCYTEDIPSNEIETWAKIQADRFRNMVIRGFHTELESVYEEYNIGLASDGRKAWHALGKMMFPSHPYGTQTTIGTQEHLKNPSITNIKNYYSRYYVPNNMAVCMAGDFNPDEVIAIIDRYFGSWQPSATLSRPEYAPVPAPAAPADTTVWGQEAEFVMLGWMAKGVASYEADTLTVVADILSNGKAGLFDIDLVAPMKVQDAGAYYAGMHDYGRFIVTASPREGQTLEEVRSLIANEMGKLRRGEFDDDLLPSVVNNLKLNNYRALLSNERRADRFVDAFINDEKWSDEVSRLDRMAGMTKQQIVDFANRHLTDNYITVYKRQGNDTTIHKIEKPAITPIPTNNDKQSNFLKEILSAHPEPIKPRFVDFDHDMTRTTTRRGLEFLYKHNDDDDLFRLEYYYPFGTESNNRYGVAADFLQYVGTDEQTNERIKRQFYKLACNYNISVGSDAISISLSGLNANMPQAAALLEHLINHAQADKAGYDSFVDLLLKDRANEKTSQQTNFSALRAFGQYGNYNSMRNQPTAEELHATDPQALLRLLSDLKEHRHTLLYYGPTPLKEVDALVSRIHSTPKKLLDAPAAKIYIKEQTPSNEVWLAPYDAKNIYLMMYHNDGTMWSPDKAALEELFNMYFSGGMNGIVFQELREARGLAYSASANYQRPQNTADTECFYTFVITQNDKMTDCIDEFNRLIDDMPEREAAFSLARQGLMKSLATTRVTRSGVLTSYLRARRLGIDYDINRKIYADLPSLTLSDLIAFARNHIARRPYRYLILGDEKNLDMQSLEKIAPVRRLATEEIFGY